MFFLYSCTKKRVHRKSSSSEVNQEVLACVCVINNTWSLFSTFLDEKLKLSHQKNAVCVWNFFKSHSSSLLLLKVSCRLLQVACVSSAPCWAMTTTTTTITTGREATQTVMLWFMRTSCLFISLKQITGDDKCKALRLRIFNALQLVKKWK